MDTESAFERENNFLLWFLAALALMLAGRITYLYLSDAHRFPLSKIKVRAPFQQVSRKQIESILTKYTSYSFFTLPVKQVQKDFTRQAWVNDAIVSRIWPDIVSISIKEKKPMAYWNQYILFEDGEMVQATSTYISQSLVKLESSDNLREDIVKIYEMVNILLKKHSLFLKKITMQDNYAVNLTLTNGITLYLGSESIDKKIMQFAKALTKLGEKSANIYSVDLRYAHGMAVRWNE